MAMTSNTVLNKSGKNERKINKNKNKNKKQNIHRQLCSILCNNLIGEKNGKRIDTCICITEKSLICIKDREITLCLL